MKRKYCPGCNQEMEIVELNNNEMGFRLMYICPCGRILYV
jgi:hypothetical protein